jgi:DNA-binding beta-propeller fold protein YncE
VGSSDLVGTPERRRADCLAVGVRGRAGQLADHSRAGIARRTGLAAVLAVAAASLALAAPAGAAVGDIAWHGCITGAKGILGSAGAGACADAPGATADGAGSGLDSPTSIAVSPDGDSAYVTSQSDDAVYGFDRAADGTLTFRRCITGNMDGSGSTGTGVCVDSNTATGDGTGSGLDSPFTSIAVSPDGHSVYVTSQSDDAVTSFNRDADGRLTDAGCITGAKNIAGSTGTGACADAPGAAANGTGSGLDSPSAPAVSPDGHSVYVVSAYDAAVASFDRAADGTLTWDGCITGAKNIAGSTGTGACADAPGAAANGTGSGLDVPTSIAVSPDGHSVYVGAQGDAAVNTFDRAADGTLTDVGCITGDKDGPGSGGTGVCTDAPGATGAPGYGSGLYSASALAVSPDGDSVYSAAYGDSAVASFDRAADGTLTWGGCITGDKGGAGSAGTGACDDVPGATEGLNGLGSGLAFVYHSIAVSPDGRSVYAAAFHDAAVAGFNRAADGSLAWDGCITGAKGNFFSGSGGTGACDDAPGATADGNGSGLSAPLGLAVSPDGDSVYAAASRAVASFTREPLTPQTSLSAGPSGTTSDNTPTFAFASDTPGASFECQIDVSPFFDCASPYTTYALADGPHRFRVRAVDGFGHTDPTPASRDFTVDTTPPVAGDTTPPETSLDSDPGKSVKTKQKKAALEFRFSSSEAGSSFLCSLDGSKEFGCAPPYEAKVKAKKKAKAHSFEVRAVDAAGNADPSPAKWDGKVKRKRKR